MNHNRERTLLVIGFISVLAGTLPGTAAAWSQRASPDDLIEMNLDYEGMLVMERLLSVPTHQLEVERLRQMLGIEAGDESILPEPAASLVRDYLSRQGPFDLHAELLQRLPFLINLYETHGLRVIRNPSASCPVAASVVGRMAGVERLLQESGADESLWLPGLAADPSSNAAQSPMARLMSEVATRCIEDAYAQCVDSGTIQPFGSMAASVSRQLRLLGGDDSDFIRRVAGRMQDCAHYELVAEVETTTETRYPPQRMNWYESTMRGTYRSKLELKFGSSPTVIEDLYSGILIGLNGPGFEFLPSFRCRGSRDAPRCLNLPTPERDMSQTVVQLGDISVNYHFDQAVVNEKAGIRGPHIAYLRYSPPAWTTTISGYASRRRSCLSMYCARMAACCTGIGNGSRSAAQGLLSVGSVATWHSTRCCSRRTPPPNWPAALIPSIPSPRWNGRSYSGSTSP